MRLTQYLTLLLSIFSTFSASGQMVNGSDTLTGNEWIRFEVPYYKFVVEADGIYRISGSALEQAGINLSSITGANARIFSMGKQIPLHISTQGTFSSEDFIEFFGHKNKSEMDRHLYQRAASDLLNPETSLYTNARSYYLTFDEETPQLLVENLDNDLINAPAPVSYVWHEEKIIYDTYHYDPYFQTYDGSITYSSYFHGEGFGKALENNTNISLASPDVATFGPPAQLHIRLVAANYQDHSFPVSWNGNQLGILLAQNIKIVDTTFSIPLSQLQDVNTLNIASFEALSRFCIAEVSISYPALLKGNAAGSFSFTTQSVTGPLHGIVENFNHQGTAPILYETDGARRMVTSLNGENNVEFNWPNPTPFSKLVLVDAASQIQHITTLERKVFQNLANDNTEYIVITHPQLMALGTESEYIQYRMSEQGGQLKAKAYDINELYDQFGYGIEKHPQAIRNFVEYIHRNWPAAKMIFIVGRAIEYNRSRHHDGTWESSFFVPTFGRPGADNLLAARLWDLVPRYPIGRLAVKDAQTLSIYLSKVKEYETALTGDQSLADKAWIKNVLHIAGGKTQGDQTAYKQVLDDLGDDLATSEFGANIFHFQKESSDAVGISQSKQMEKLLHEGSSIINYLGHSSTSTFEYAIPDPNQWDNKGRYPVFSGMGCSAGQIHGTIYGLSDRFVLIPDEGAIAFISGSGSQYASALVQWGRPWYEYLGNEDYGGYLGQSVLHGLQAVSDFVNLIHVTSNPYRYLIEQQTLQGDPALRINPLPGPDYLVDQRSVVLQPALLNTKLDSFDLSFTISNIGRNLRDEVGYTISLRSQSGEENMLLTSTVQTQTFETPVQIKLPLLINKKPGIYRLLISLDPQDHIAELPAPLAETNNQLRDNAGVEGIVLLVIDNLITPVFPPDFSIVNKDKVTLTASTSNAFAAHVDVVIEIDTNALFNSPEKIKQIYFNHQGPVSWEPAINMVPGQEYFWRVSTDSLSPEQGYIWRKRSFTYLPDHPEGWSQSHFHQLTDDALDQIVSDSSRYAFTFDRSPKNYTMLNRYHDVDLGLIPYFFEDGKFNAKLAQRFRNVNVQGFVVAIDSATGRYIMNPPGGIHGSTGDVIPMEGFAYNLNADTSRQAMINLIENIIPDGYYVFFYTYQHTGFPTYSPETWAADEVTYGKSIFSVIESQYPDSKIRTLEEKGSVPYIVLFQKGRKAIEETIAQDVDDVINISFDGGALLHEGSILSVPVGPATSWGRIEQQITRFAHDTAGVTRLSAWAMNEARTDTFWISTDITDATLDISEVDASLYPYVQLALHTSDSVFYKNAKIDHWRVLYTGLPECLLQTSKGFVFNRDTLFEGQPVSISTFVENLSSIPVDSLPVSLRIISPTNQTIETRTFLHPVNAYATVDLSMTASTKGLDGDHQVVLEINPDRSIQEQLYSNNIGVLSMHVITDKVNPILDVTFDGEHIKDGDPVGARPLIRIRLMDENEFVRLEDTSIFEIALQFPSQGNMETVWFTDPRLTFTPALSTGPNEAFADLLPYLHEEGLYHLRVFARDAADNPSGENEYMISFRVTHASSVSEIYNFPNPFIKSTQFFYTLTGEGAPDYYAIQIVNAAGILVKEISSDEIGPLIVGSHATLYEWDGTDDQGRILPGGMYFYTLIARDVEGRDFPRYRFGPGNYESDRWGKLVILR